MTLNKVPDNAILLTTNMVWPFPSIPHNEGLKIVSIKNQFQPKI